MKKVPLNIRIAAPLMKKVRDAAQRDNRSVTNYVETLLKNALENDRKD